MRPRAVTLQAPFPWFGGKSRVAHVVWERFGDVKNYVEPFFGSGAVLLLRPQPFSGVETINDKDGFVANFWRSIKLSPEETAKHADHPVFENDLHARHIYLVERREELRARLEGDPDYHDPKIAGFWAWGICASIGNNFCASRGPWSRDDKGKLTRFKSLKSEGAKDVTMSPKEKSGVKRALIQLTDAGSGVNRPFGGKDGQTDWLRSWFEALSKRLRYVRVASGDWSRVASPSVIWAKDCISTGATGVFLDPPYSEASNSTDNLYAEHDSTLAHDVRAWAIEHGERKDMRIALCGYEGEHEMPSSWSVFAHKAAPGYAVRASGETQGKRNRHRERIWFSPYCHKANQLSLF